MRRAEFIERLAGVGRLGDGRQHHGRIGRALRQPDIVLSDQAMGNTSGLHMPRIGEHGLRERQLGLRQRIRRKPGKGRRLVVGGVETVGVGILEAGNHRLAARILHALVEPKRRQIALLIEGLDGRMLLFVGEDAVRFRGQEIANPFRDRAIGGIERGQSVGRPALFGRNRWSGCLRSAGRR